MTDEQGPKAGAGAPFTGSGQGIIRDQGAYSDKQRAFQGYLRVFGSSSHHAGSFNYWKLDSHIL